MQQENPPMEHIPQEVMGESFKDISLDKAMKANQRRKFVQDIVNSTPTKLAATLLLLTSLFAATFAIAYQDVQKKQIKAAQNQIPKAEIVLPNIVEHTTETKNTYTNSKARITFEYPASVSVEEYKSDNKKYLLVVSFKDPNNDKREGDMKTEKYFSGDISLVTKNPKLTLTDYVSDDICQTTMSLEKAANQKVTPLKTCKTNLTKSFFPFTAGSLSGVTADINPYESSHTYYLFELNKNVVIMNLFGSEGKSPSITAKKQAEQMIASFKQLDDTAQFCGGIAAIKCPTGYQCKLDGSYPDSGGTCVKQ